MKIQPSPRLTKLKPYPFDEVDRLVGALKAKGVTPIDFGVGDPIDPTPKFIREACQKGVDIYQSSGYPSYIGLDIFRKKIAQWMKKRFGVVVDPQAEICSTIGSKEAIFNFPEAILSPGDVVLMPTPGYPPYKTGTLFAEGISYFYPLTAENNFQPDFDSFPQEVLKKAKILWINYPNNPTGRVAPKEFFLKAIEFCHKHDIILASDECYTEIYFDDKPHGALEFSKEGVITFHSLSKRSNMTGYRVGWAVGDSHIIKMFKQLKTNVDSGTPNFVQAAAIAALSDEKHVEQAREVYKKKRNILLSALKTIGLPKARCEGTFYVWQPTPPKMDSVEFSKKLLDPKIAVVVTPGEWISDVTDTGVNPGKNFVRFALVPSLQDTEQAAKRIQAHLSF